MASIELSTVVEAPLEDVWEVISDLDRYPEWVAFVDSVTRVDGESIGRGTSFRGYGGIGPLKTDNEWCVTVFDPPRWLTYECDLRVIRPTLAFELARAEEGTRLRQTAEFTFLPQFPRLGWWLEVVFIRHIVHLFVGQAMKPGLRRTIRDAKRLVESEVDAVVE